MNSNPNANPNDLFARGADSLLNQMTRLSLHPKLSTYPAKADDAGMKALIHTLTTIQSDRLRQVALATNTEERLEARKEEWRRCQRVGDEFGEKGKESLWEKFERERKWKGRGEEEQEGRYVRDVWRGWMELLKWEMLVSEVEERLGLVAV
ncbi:hypothetical protein IFR04_009323 [Cadophora malorum]|uniref:Uncharacterized protein n=1 Tax=Cadophora malorum TaxID=108018 RepID=A0A8H7TDK1_9HELO|nr:hypothetical protein IFR04_009323 [Cadophora malorum]